MHAFREKILIVKLSSLGDIVHTLPVLLELSAKFSERKFEISWLASEKFQALLETYTQVKNLFFLPKALSKKLALLKELRRQNFDYIFELQGLLKTSLIARLISGRQKKVHGVLPARETLAPFFWDFKYEQPVHKKHVIYKNLSILRALSTSYSPEEAKLDFSALPEFRRSKHKYLVLAPSTTWKSKHWPESNWLELQEKILDKFSLYKIIWLGDQRHPFFAYKFRNSKVENLIGKTSLSQALKIVSQAELVIGLDSGLTHFAHACKVKVIALFGPTNQERNGVLRDLDFFSRNIYQTDLACRPCQKRVCFLKEEAKYQCLEKVSVERVFDNVNRSLLS